MLGEERHHRREHAQRLHERVPERPERGLVLARSAGASGGCTSSTDRRRTPRTRGSRRRSASPRSAASASRTNACVRSTSQRSSGRSAGGPASRSADAARSPRCSRTRRRTTTEFQNVSSLRLISCAGPKPKAGSGRAAARSTASASRRRPSARTRPRPRSCSPTSRASRGRARRASSRSRAPAGTASGRQHDRHEELRVEPEPDLLAHLRHPVGREPLLPVGMVGQIGMREPASRAGRVAPGDSTRRSPSRASRTGRCPRRARRRRPRARARPARRTPRSGSARGRSTAGAAPRAGRARRRRARTSSAFDPITFRCPHEHGIERQRQAVVAAARDVPVAHVAQPVVHALAHVLGHPFDAPFASSIGSRTLVDADEPVVGDAEDERRVAAPAVRIAVLVVPGPTRNPRSPRSPMI